MNNLSSCRRSFHTRQSNWFSVARHLQCSLAFAIGIVSLLSALASLAQSRNPDNESRIVDDFGTRITKYLELRKAEAGSPPKPTNSPAKLTESEQQMAEEVKAARPRAKQGDIFTPEIADYLRNQIAAALHGKDGPRIRTSLQRAEPIKHVPLHVNESYPRGLPLQSMPPSLLLNLPTLPKELEYRIVGQDLVLHDVAANLVVDIVPDAVPSP